MSARGRGRGRNITNQIPPGQPNRSQSVVFPSNGRENGSTPFRAKSHRRPASFITNDNVALSIVQRPDPGGTAGRRLKVFANHFRCVLPRNLQFHQYDMELERGRYDQTWRPAPRDDRTNVLSRILQRYDFPFVWHDEAKSLYSIERIDELQGDYQIELKEAKTDRQDVYRLRLLKWVKTYDIQVLWDFIHNRLAIRPRDPIRVLEILLKQTTRTTMVCVKNQFYNRQQVLDDLEDGRGLAHGLYQAMFLTQIGATININTTFTCFYQPMKLIDFISAFLQRDITRGFDEKDQKIILSKVLKSIWVETDHTGIVRKYRVRSFNRPAAQMTFDKIAEDNSEERITVENYFLEKYGKKLSYPHLPTLELYVPHNKSRMIYLPLECCQVQPWQRCTKPLTTEQRTRVTKRTVVDPDDRYRAIMDAVRKRDFNHDPYVQTIGLRVDEDEMIRVNARIINPPAIMYRSGRDAHTEVVERINIGKWNLRNRFITERTINQWACVLISSHNLHESQLSMANEFVERFSSSIRHYGLYFRQSPSMYNEYADATHIERRMEELKQMHCEVVIFILNAVSEDIYKAIKYLGNQKLGLITQCTDFVAITRNIKTRKLDMYLQNLFQKFNAKIGGVNGRVALTEALTHSATHDDVFMFFGADVTHTSCTREKPSIAAVIGSVDSTSTQYASRLSEQYPAHGKISLEIIKDLYQMATDLLKLFAQRNRCFPNKIVFYRDGVDDGHFQKVLDDEVRALKNACRALYLDHPLPKITFIIVKKRHNTRFFVQDNTGRCVNLQPGTVIDTELVHPHDFDFYLNSHAAMQGTSRPILYHVLYDEIGFSSDEIQSLTYYLCHADVRCTKAVSIPAPVHYAHLAAYQSRDAESYDLERKNHLRRNEDKADNYDLEEDDEDEQELRDRFESMGSEDVQTRLIQLDPTIQDTMWYV